MSEPRGSRVLVLGGTSWLGGAVARHALTRGHEVVCLARGESGPVPEGAHLVRGDRTTPDAYAALPDGRWDLVVDVTREPAQARGALAALADRADGWAFVSSGSVYADHSVVGGGLGGVELPLLPPVEDPLGSPEAYGGAKVACEDALRAVRGEDALVARSGLIAGRGDPSDRVGYWVGRCALAAEDGQPVLVPEDLGAGAQFVDVLDLAAWLVDAGLAGRVGTVDAYGPRRTLGELIEASAAVAGFDGPRVALPDAVLLAAGVDEFMGERSLALWMADPAWRGFAAHEDVTARAAGLVARPLAETLSDALAHERHLGLGRTGRRAGLDRADELALLRQHASG